MYSRVEKNGSKVSRCHKGKGGPVLIQTPKQNKMDNAPYRKTPREKTILITKIIGGILLVPILTILFFADRVVLIFLPHVKGETIQESFRHLKHFLPILYRVGAISIIYLLILLYEYLF